MMDIKDIIKWFIPCFHIFLTRSKFKFRCLFLFLIFASNVEAKVHSVTSGLNRNYIKNVYSIINHTKNLSERRDFGYNLDLLSSSKETEMGRTFGRPFKKMMGALLPLVFQIGAASTWAVVAAVVGVKTLLVALIILKLLLVAGAAKFGSLFAHKTEHQTWAPPHQKEIHLHIHNSQQPGIHEHITDWSRDGVQASDKSILDPYTAGPQTIHTPFGNYIKVNKR